MASQPGPSESTPLLAGNDQTDHQDEIESHSLKASPANAHFKLPIQILTIITSFLSLSIFGLLIATYVLIATGPFNFYYFGVTQDAVRHLAITSFVTVIYSALTIPLQISIIINIAINIVVLVLTFVYSDEILGKGWPRNVGYALCGRPVDRECLQAIMAVRITMAVSAGVGILIGVLLGIVLLLRLAALARTIVLQGKVAGDFGGPNPTGLRVQFTVSNERPVAAGNLPPSGGG